MLMKIKKALTSRALFVAGGLAAVSLVVALTWLDLARPLNLRQPFPSEDGSYFAYFDLVESGSGGREGAYDLIISTPEGGMVARYRMDPGEISWSNAGHLAVVREKQSQATLVSNAARTFVVLTSLAFSPGTEPRWSRSGTKLAYVRSGPAGPEIAVYDLLQTQASTVPPPQEFRLDHPVLLFWSPGGQELYFLNSEGSGVVLYKLEVISGKVQPIARSALAWGGPVLGLPVMSPDGTKIYLPRPLDSFVDAATGATLWSLPAEGKVLWSAWSANGGQLFYARTDAPGRIYAYDFSGHAERVILSGVPANGFFSADGSSYFFKTHPRLRPETYRSQISEWLAATWEWQHVDRVTQITQPLGREELWPWEMTRKGLILMSRDDFARVRYGLYDPNARILSEFHFPTDQEDVLRQLGSHLIMLLTIALYGLLGFFVFFRRAESAPARALYILSLVLMVLFTSLDVARSSFSLYASFGLGAKSLKLAALGWLPLLPRAHLMDIQFFLFMAVLALVPPALLHFAVVFPEGNRFLAPRKALWVPLYGAAFLPAIDMAMVLTSHRVPAAIRPLIAGLTFIAAGVAMVTALLALFYNYRHPPDRRAKDQIRWVALAFMLPLFGSLILFAVNWLLRSFLGTSLRHFLDVLSTTTLSLLCLFTPLAIGYALVAHKLFDIHLLIRRTVRYALLISVVVVVYLLLVGGLSWAIAGSLSKPSDFVIVASTLLTAIVLAPVRRRLEKFIGQTFDRKQYDFRETLKNFASGLPSILDRPTLASVTCETVRGAMKARASYLFAFDRQTKKFRPERTPSDLPEAIAEVEFDPAEPLCRYLVERGRPFEVEVSPYDPRLIPIFQSAADRLGKMQAAVVFGLERRRELVGLMVLGGKLSDEFYNTDDLELLTTVAHQAAIAIENAALFEEVAQDRELRKELEIAGEVQAQLFPSVLPQTVGCQIAGRCVPARSVSGDYYDFLELPGQKIGLAIGDVSGKGVSASLLMANLQGLLRTQAPTAASLADLVRRINRQLYASSRGAKFCTFFYGVYDEAERLLEFVNAGHNPPLLLGPGGVRFLESTGVPLGLFQEVSHEERHATLENGATVILYSDGVTEARNKQGELFGLDRLIASASGAENLDAAGMIERVLNDVREFTGSAPNEDDRTLVVLKVPSAEGSHQ